MKQIEKVRLTGVKVGAGKDSRKAARTIRVDLSDRLRFSPDAIQVKQGDTVRFVVRNSGKTMHEMVLGTMKELKDHAELMKKHPGMEHDEPYMAHVGPGKTAEIVWQFTKAGEFYFGCLVPGHFEAGMVGRVMALDLSDEYEVTSVDVSAANLEPLRKAPVKCLQADLSVPGAVHRIVGGADLVIGAVPGWMGFAALGEVIAAGQGCRRHLGRNVAQPQVCELVAPPFPPCGTRREQAHRREDDERA